MRKFLPILALVAVTCWSAGEVSAGGDADAEEPHGPAGFKKHHNLHTGFRDEHAYRVGFNLAWAEGCSLSGSWDKVQALYKKTKKILSDKDRSLFD